MTAENPCPGKRSHYAQSLAWTEGRKEERKRIVEWLKKHPEGKRGSNVNLISRLAAELEKEVTE